MWHLSKRIFSISYDPRLSAMRERLLRTFGYRVKSTLSLEEAFRLILTRQFDVVLIGYTVTEHERKTLISHIRARDPHIQIIFVVAYDREDSEPLADMKSKSKPDELLRAIKVALASPRGSGKTATD